MIPENKRRVIMTLPEEQEKQLKYYCKENNISKSVALSMALSLLFSCGYKLGDILGQKLFENQENKEEE